MGAREERKSKEVERKRGEKEEGQEKERVRESDGGRGETGKEDKWERINCG